MMQPGTIQAWEEDPLRIKMEETSDYRLDPGKSVKGVSYIPSKYLEIRKDMVVPLSRVKALTFVPEQEANLMIIPPASRERVKPFYKADQVDSFYYADKPKGILLLPPSKDSLASWPYGAPKKVISPLRSAAPRFAWVNVPYIIDDAAIYIDPGDMDPRVLVAIMNSSLMWYWLSRGGKGSIILDGETLGKAPIKKVSGTLHYLLKTLSNDMYNLKKARRTYIDLWRNYSGFFKVSSKTLADIIREDRIRGDGDQDRWFEEVDLPREGSELLYKEFDSLIVSPDQHTRRMVISAEENGRAEVKLGEMTFTKGELMLHVYCSMASKGMSSFRSLDEMLKLTDVPIIEPEPAKQSGYIFRAVASDFHNYIMVEKLVVYDFKVLDNEMLDVPMDILGVERRMRATQSELDALVFKLYGLDEGGVKRVMASLRTEAAYREEVLRRYLLHAKEPLDGMSTDAVKASVTAVGETCSHEECECKDEKRA